MTTDQVLAVIRQKIGQAIGEVAGDAPSYSDEFLLQYVETEKLTLETLGISPGVTVYSGTISPDPSIPIGMLLALGAAASLVSDDLVYRLRNGELGLSFSSGATTISTIQAGNILKNFAFKLEGLHNLLLTAYLGGDPNTVLYRVT